MGFSKKVLLIATLALSPLSVLAEDRAFREVSFQVELTQAPKQAGEAVQEILKSDEGQIFATAIAEYFGIPSTVTQAGLAVFRNYEAAGEIQEFEMALPDGFKPCQIRLKHMSLVGPGSYTLSVRPDSIHGRFYLKRQGPTKGGTSIILGVEVLGIYWRNYRGIDAEGNQVRDPAYLDGTCRWNLRNAGTDFATIGF